MRQVRDLATRPSLNKNKQQPLQSAKVPSTVFDSMFAIDTWIAPSGDLLMDAHNCVPEWISLYIADLDTCISDLETVIDAAPEQRSGVISIPILLDATRQSKMVAELTVDFTCNPSNSGAQLELMGGQILEQLSHLTEAIKDKRNYGPPASINLILVRHLRSGIKTQQRLKSLQVAAKIMEVSATFVAELSRAAESRELDLQVSHRSTAPKRRREESNEDREVTETRVSRARDSTRAQRDTSAEAPARGASKLERILDTALRLKDKKVSSDKNGQVDLAPDFALPASLGFGPAPSAVGIPASGSSAANARAERPTAIAESGPESGSLDRIAAISISLDKSGQVVVPMDLYPLFTEKAAVRSAIQSCSELKNAWIFEGSMAFSKALEYCLQRRSTSKRDPFLTVMAIPADCSAGNAELRQLGAMLVSPGKQTACVFSVSMPPYKAKLWVFPPASIGSLETSVQSKAKELRVPLSDSRLVGLLELPSTVRAPATVRNLPLNDMLGAIYMLESESVNAVEMNARVKAMSEQFFASQAPVAPAPVNPKAPEPQLKTYSGTEPAVSDSRGRTANTLPLSTKANGSQNSAGALNEEDFMAALDLMISKPDGQKPQVAQPQASQHMAGSTFVHGGKSELVGAHPNGAHTTPAVERASSLDDFVPLPEPAAPGTGVAPLRIGAYQTNKTIDEPTVDLLEDLAPFPDEFSDMMAQLNTSRGSGHPGGSQGMYGPSSLGGHPGGMYPGGYYGAPPVPGMQPMDGSQLGPAPGYGMMGRPPMGAPPMYGAPPASFGTLPAPHGASIASGSYGAAPSSAGGPPPSAMRGMGSGSSIISGGPMFSQPPAGLPPGMTPSIPGAVGMSGPLPPMPGMTGSMPQMPGPMSSLIMPATGPVMINPPLPPMPYIGGGGPRRIPCRFFNSGTCNQGNHCKFLHVCHMCGQPHPALEHGAGVQY